MPLHLAVLALLQAPVPARPFVACTLEIHGSLNTRRPSANGPETVSETFQYALPGWIQEREKPGGQTCFEFHPSQDPKLRPTGILNRHTETKGKAGHHWTQFYGSEFRAVGVFRFEADLRGQNLYPSGELKVGGRITDHQSSTTSAEAQSLDTFPFPVIRRSPSDHGAPTLRFTLSSLWKLHKAPGPFAAKGFLTYQNKVGAASYAGRVDITFRLDPRNQVERP
jgi:hypothetical protein